MLFWRYCKDMQTSYFGYFGHAWLHTPKMIVSTCTRLWCLSVCKKQTSSFTSFLRYYILKNPAVWLADSILIHTITWELEFCQIWDWWWNINNNISLHFRLFPRKSDDKIFQKIPKPYFGAILSPLCQTLGKNEFSWKAGLCQFLDIPIIYHRAKNQKKLMSHFRENAELTNRHRQWWFYWILCRKGVQQLLISCVIIINCLFQIKILLPHVLLILLIPIYFITSTGFYHLDESDSEN